MATICGSCLQKILKKKSLRFLHYQFTHPVSTWSPLAAVFNTRPSRELSFSYVMKEPKGLLLIPQLRNYEGFDVLQDNVHREVDSLVTEVLSPDRKRKVVQIFDQLSDSICKVADMADFLRVSHPDEQFQLAAEDTVIKLSGVVEKLNTNTEIYKVLKKTLQTDDLLPMDAVDRRVAELFLFDFEQSGIHLDEKTRKKFVTLNENCIMIGNFFMQRAQLPVSVPKSKLPQNIQHCFNIDGDNIMVNGLYQEHWNDMVREAAYRIYLHPHEHQLNLLDDLLKTRYELAKLVGFPTYAHRAIKGTMAETPENVMDFLDALSDRIKERANKDYAAILALKKEKGQSTSNIVMPWDPPYYTALGRHKKYHINSDDLAPYFSLGSCMEGLNNVLRSLYDVTLQAEKTRPGEVWSHDVHKLAVVHRSEGILGYIYCDFYDRPGKPMQDCHFTIQGGREIEDSTYQYPVVVLNLSLPPPQNHMPSLLTPSMIENLFHEFGHAMHSMLGRTKYQHVTGTRCSTDFAEVPSELMEYFVSDPRVLSTFARHYRTGEPLPMKTIQQLCQAKKMFAASDTQLQVFYSVLNHMFHGEYPLPKSTTDILADVQGKYYGIPHVEGTAWHLRFSHLVGYGAKYYSYLMSRAVASRIWHKCFKQDPFNRNMGERYRQEMLAHGGGKSPKELVEAMLQETPTVDKLVDSLMEDLDISTP